MSGLSHRYWLTLLLSLAALLPLIPIASGAAPPGVPPAITAPDHMPPNPHLPPDVLERMRGLDAETAGQWRFHEHPVRDRGKEGMENNPAAGVIQPLVSGTKSMPCVLIKFPDQTNTYSKENFQNMLFSTTAGSARNFYLENSYGALTLTGQTTVWYTSANTKSYYGRVNGSARAAALAKEAAQQADAAGFDWAPYDNNHDGYVDALWMVHSGRGCEESGNTDDIWAHSWDFSSAGIGAYTTSTPDPYHPGQYVKINAYITMPETSYWSGGNGSILQQVGIGVFCHEFGHALGLPDLYDTGGTGQGLGNASLMAGGSWGGNGSDSRYPAHIDAWCKADMGWLTPTTVTTNGSYTVNNIETSQSCYLVRPLGSSVNQYFLVENREHVGYDNTLFATGLFIYHVDTDVISSYRAANRINTNTHPYGVALEEADATTDAYGSMHLFLGSYGRGNSTDSWPNGTKTSFTESSTPSTKTNAGVLYVCGVTDMPANSNAMTVNIYVTSSNTPPVAVGDSYSTNEDTALTVAAPGVLGNDTDTEGNPLTASKVSNPANGSVTLNSDGSFTYTSNANFNGSDSFTYKANDGTADSNTATVSITVTPVNDQPQSNDDSYTTNEDTVLTVGAPGVLENDFDVDGDPLTAVQVNDTTNGTATLNSDGSLTYTPNANFHGVDYFNYQASDGIYVSGWSWVMITVTSVNDPPVAGNDSYTTNEDTPLTVPAPGVLGNDTDVEGGPLTAIKLTDPANGTVTLNSDGSFTYTPTANFHGADSFTYKANDGAADSNVATVSITVNSVNDLPQSYDDYYSTNEDTVLTVAAPGVLANDFDVDGDPLSAVKVNDTTNGTVTLNSDGSFTYTPTANFHGNDYLSYRASDGLYVSGMAWVTITITSVNDPPVANNDSYSTNEDIPLTVNTPGVLGNDTDADGNPLTAVLVSGPASGMVNLFDSGSFSYQPALNFHGADSFTYQANDGLASSNIATVTLNVISMNDSPVANDDSYNTPQETPLVVGAPGVLGNDTDADGDTLSAIKVSDPSFGTLAFNADGSFTYSPQSTFSGEDSFTYQANDGTANSNVATVTINVASVNTPPVAVDDSYSTAEDTLLAVPRPGVLGNDSDADGDPLSANLITFPASGGLGFGIDGHFNYVPNDNFTGVDSFTYAANDGLTNSNTATVTITVTPVNDPPMAVVDSYSTAEDTALTVAAPGVLGNDSDIDGDPLTANLVAGPASGLLALKSDGSFTYTPDANFNGADSFTYTANDGTVNSDITKVSLTVTAANDPPVANPQSVTTNEDVNTGITLTGSDVDEDPLFFSVVTQPTNGVLVGDAPDLEYQPAANYNGADSFTFRVSDGKATSDPATVSITMNPVNDAPVANDDEYSTPEDTTLTVTAPGVLGNDNDIDGDPLSAHVVDGPATGQLVLNDDGSFTYTPIPKLNDRNGSMPSTAFDQQVSFTYQANDGAENSNTATVTINLTFVNTPPVAVDDSYSTAEDATLTVDAPGIIGNDSDANGDPLGVNLLTSPAGDLAIGNGGGFTYTPVANFHGIDSFTYNAYDGTAYSNTATVTITVTPVNDPPMAVVDSYSTAEDTALTVAAPGVLGNDSDIDGDPLTANLVAGPASGLLALNSDGGFTYTPDANFNGADSFTYTANDGTVASDITKVSLTVTAVNDPPVANPQSVTTNEDVNTGITLTGSDVDEDPLFFSVVTQPTNGILVGDAPELEYQPAANANGADSFTFRVSDGKATSDPATVSITVNPVNDAPVATNGSLTTVQDTPANGTLQASDVDGDPLTFSIVANGGKGTAAVTDVATGAYTYTPNAGASGADSFTFKASDGLLDSNTATVAITITPSSNPPTAVADAYSMAEDTSLAVTAPGVLGNDSDPNGDPLTAVLVDGPASGALALDNNGGFSYTPVLHFFGSVSFTYKANDGTADSNVATVDITVNSVNDAPVAQDSTLAVQFNTPATGTFLCSDVEGDPVTCSIVSNGTKGTVVVTDAAVGAFTYTPNTGATGADSFTFKACDGLLDSNIATVRITIASANRPPVALGDIYTTNKTGRLTVGGSGVLRNDWDWERGRLTAVLVTGPQHGTLTFYTNGSFSYVANAGYIGIDSFTYQASDGSLRSNTAKVTILVFGKRR